MQTILVLGASGFIGSAITQTLIQDYNIVAVDRVMPEGIVEKNNYRYIQADFSKITDFKEMLVGVDKVVHLISTTVPTNSTNKIMEELQDNIVPTICLLNDMVAVGVKEIVFASSAGTVYGETDNINYIYDNKNPICSYGVEKMTIEAYISIYERYHGIVGKIVRFSNPYGVGQNPNKQQGVIPIFIRKNMEKKEIFAYGDTYRDYIFIDDLIDGLEKVISYEGAVRTFQLCSGVSHKLSEVIESIENIMSKKFVKINKELLRTCDVRNNFLDVSETIRTLNWNVSTDLSNGIKKIVDQL